MGEDFLNIAREYQEKIEDELKEICKETIDLVEGVLLPRLLGGTEHYEQQHQEEQKQGEEGEEGEQGEQQQQQQYHESPKTVTALLSEASK